MRNKRGFTLIELLAVIIILGVLMLIAIPSVTEYISESKRKAYLTTANNYIGATVNRVNSLELPISDPNTTYYIPISSIQLENGGKSPYGDWEDAYVVVTFDGTNYSYYWTSLDETGHAILLTYGKSLTNESIVANIPNLDLTVGVGERSNIGIVAPSGTIDETLPASTTIEDGGSLREGTTPVEIPIITLIGNSNINIEYGSTYTDPGATATDNEDGNLTDDIITTNNVNTNVLGTYTVTYNVSDSSNNDAIEVVRTVNVVDTTDPVITLTGDQTIAVELGGTYTELGATASDNVNGNITGNIVITGSVNTSATGSYTITYSISDAAGNTAQVQRTVAVYEGSTSFAYTGSAQTYTVLLTGSYKIEAWGAYSAQIGNRAGGKGGYASGIVTLSAGQVLNIYVGGSGSLSTYGWNGGGTNHIFSTGRGGGGGGGATDVRINGTDLKNRIIVAGGGGGAVWGDDTNGGIGGYGGGLTGGSSVTSYYSSLATGGTQTAGGAKGIYTQYASYTGYDGQDGSFGQGGNSGPTVGSGSGGGGYYGGGSGSRNGYLGLSGGGGGSSFVSGYTGCDAVDANGSHTGQPNHFSGLIFTSGQIISGNASMPNPSGGTETGHTGNGYLKITKL